MALLALLVSLPAGASRASDGGPSGSGSIPRAMDAAACCASSPAAQDSVSSAVARLLAVGPPAAGYAPHRWDHVRRLYERRDDAPLWTDGARPGERARLLVDALARASDQGLRIDVYPWVELRSALAAVPGGSAAALARADVLLTASFVAYAEDLLTGQVNPREVNPAWHVDPQEVDVDSALVRTLARADFGEALALLPPRDADYPALMRELARYRAIVADGGWPEVPAVGVLRPGGVASATSLGALLARLHAEGFAQVTPLEPATGDGGADDARGPQASVVYDAQLAGAVAGYQARHGLAVDSVVGPNTLASLNRPAEYRLRQIAANLERHRWLPRERGDRYVLVNVPAFRLRAIDGGREALAMKVVVGAEYDDRATPAFSDSMAYVVFRPYWNVPQGIAARELWPKQRRDPSYFARNGYEVVHASWGTYVRQKPAPDNALGQAKFIFPNDYAIYLHDTPAQALFSERVRAFSHGCIRVEHPDLLARFVLGPQGWDLDRVHDAMERGDDDTRVNLDRKLPVYIVYFTTYMRDGALHYGRDVYERDAALMRAVRGAARPEAAVVAQANAVRESARAAFGS